MSQVTLTDAQVELAAAQNIVRFPTIEQLEIALKAGDGDFYQLSAAEARLKLMRAEREQEARQSKRP